MKIPAVPYRASALASIARAALWMSGALVSFVAMAVSGRVLGNDMGTFQVLLSRSVVGLAVVLVLIARSGGPHLRWHGLPAHVLRNIIHFGGQFGWFYGLAHIPIAEVVALEFTTPLWTALLAAVLLGERLTRVRIQAIVLGMVSVLIILRPGLAIIDVASLAVLGAALCYATTYLLTKRLLLNGATPLAVLFWMTAVQLPLALTGALPEWTPLAWHSVPWIVLVGVTALSAHYCLARALTLADAAVVVPLDFLRLPLVAVVGWLVWDERLEWFVLAGALLMLAGNYLNLRAERRGG